MLLLDCFDLVSPRATHVHQHDGIIALFETLGDMVLERKEIEPICTTVTLACHPEIEIVEVVGMFWEPFKKIVLGVESLLERTVHGIGGVLILVLGEEGRKSHGGMPDEIKVMIDACFKLWDDQVLGDVIGYVAINTSFTDGVYSDKVSKKAQ